MVCGLINVWNQGRFGVFEAQHWTKKRSEWYESTFLLVIAAIRWVRFSTISILWSMFWVTPWFGRLISAFVHYRAPRRPALFVAKNNVHIEIISYHRRKHKCSVLFSVYRLLFNSYPIYPLHCILLIFQCVYEKDFSIYRFNFSSILELTRKDQRMQRDLMYHGIVWLLSKVVWYLFDFKCKSIERWKSGLKLKPIR